MKNMRALVFFMSLVHVLNASLEEAQGGCQDDPCNSTGCLKVGRVEFGTTFGDYIGIRQGYSELGVFGMVETPSDAYVFLEGRGFLLSHNDEVASIGLGFRKPLECFCPLIVGANIYYDYRMAHGSREEDCDCCSSRSLRQSFGSLGLGFEVLGGCVDFRTNVYLPVKNKEAHTSHFSYPDGYLAQVKTSRYIPYGIDAEVGKTLNFYSNFFSTGAIGGYGYFYQSSRKIYGTFVRAELDWGDYISVQARYSYDQHYHSGFQGKILFSLPFEQLASCFDACSAICFDPLTQPVRRNYIPFTHKKCCWKWNW